MSAEAGPRELPHQLYRERRARFAAEHDRLSARSRAFSYARLATFLAGVACLAAILALAGRPPAWAIAGAAGAFLVFFVLTRLHDRVIRREETQGELVRLQDEALARLDRRFADLAEPEPPPGARAEALARDLNLFGPTSLFKLLGIVQTPPGRTTLAGWLLRPAPPAEIARRQPAVRELAAALDLRHRLALAGRALAKQKADAEAFLVWAESEPWLLSRPSLVWASRGLTLVTAGLLAFSLAGWVSPSTVFLLVMFNLFFDYLCAKGVHGVFARVEAGEGGFLAYAHALEGLAEPRFADPHLTALQARLRPGAGEGEPAHEAMARLHRLVVLADVRHSSLGHALLTGLFLWDFHVLARLESWQRREGRRARAWLDTLGELEALAALADLAFNQPGWAFPRIDETDRTLTARELGHPLLADASRVANDVSLGPPGTFLLVTGSNMSGKSTLLRAIGLNAVLAQAGGPVCAAEMSLPPCRVGTSLLVEDSLASGVSFFLAELQRLKTIADAARAEHAAGRTLLFLLDEVLRGTNSAERRIAVRRVLLHLAAHGAIGAITTHDLALAEEPEVATRARPVHFRETLHAPGEGPPMTFDYVLRPGLATTVNALRLLELVGIEEG